MNVKENETEIEKKKKNTVPYDMGFLVRRLMGAVLHRSLTAGLRGLLHRSPEISTIWGSSFGFLWLHSLTGLGYLTPG